MYYSMKVIFCSQIPRDIGKPFAIYLYDEVIARHPSSIDIRAIIKNKSDVWLDEVNASFALLSAKFVRHTRWWWLTGMSRLDARPWVQEHLFKPVLFARSVLEWMSEHPDIDEIYLINCPRDVALYLKDFNSDLIIEGLQKNRFQRVFIFLIVRHAVIAFLKLIKNALHVLRHHVFQKGTITKTEHLALYDAVVGLTITSGYEFYYDGLFDNSTIASEASLSYGCIDSVFTPVNKLRKVKDDKVFIVLDHISLAGYCKSFLITLYLIFLAAWIALGKNTCRIGMYQSNKFWSRYLLNELSRTYMFSPICCYFALSKILNKHKYKSVISSYEEKIIDRSVLFACQEVGVPVTGYIPHPQHHLALALRDIHKPNSPKPQRYAVCGPKYINYFQSWCGKDPQMITVWGSKKASKHERVVSQLNRNDLKVLMLISHPNELRVFDSWLRAEGRLTKGVKYYLRMYKAASNERFSEEIKCLMGHFDCIEEIDGEFKENVDCCDIAGFCATSAGLLAVNYGLISIHLRLDDFFEINPCFNDVDFMLSCANASNFADCLDVLCSLEADDILGQHLKEAKFVDQIFSPVQNDAIISDLSGEVGKASSRLTSVNT